jgi:chitin synthase
MHEGAIVMNPEVLETVAEFLGVSNAALAELFSFKTVLVRKEVCTTFLDPEQAELVRDELARTLYSLLFSWLNEHLNQKLCKDSFGSFTAMVDFPGLQNNAGPTLGVNSVDQFCFNFANEKEHNWILHRIHEAPLTEGAADNLAIERIPYFDNTECLKMLSDPKAGLIAIADDQAKRKKSDQNMLEQMSKRYAGHSSFQAISNDRNGSSSFTINHYGGPVSYSVESFVERNANETSADILRLLRGTSTGTSNVPDHQGSNNPFIRSLVSARSIATQAHPRNDDTIVAAQQPVKPMRAPSMRRKPRSKLSAVSEAEEDDEVGGGNDEGNAGTHLQCVAGQHWQALQTLFASFDQAQPWYTFCLRPNDSQLPGQIETRSLKAQIRSLGLTEIALRLRVDYEVRMTHEEFAERYHDEFSERAIANQGSPSDRCRDLKRVLKLTDAQMAVGSRRVFMSNSAFHRFEDRLREEDGSTERQNAPSANPFEDPFAPGHAPHASSPEPEAMFDFTSPNDSQLALPLFANQQPTPNASPLDGPGGHNQSSRGGFAPSQGTSPWGDAQSNIGSESYAPSRNMFRDMEKKGEKDVLDNLPDDNEVVEEYKESGARRRWVWFCRLLTWWCPDFLLNSIGRMKRQDIRQAWREKLAINIIIWFICGCTVFVIAILGLLICPRQHVYTNSELQSHDYKDNPGSTYIAIRGEVFDLTKYWPMHATQVPVVDKKNAFTLYGGVDATDIFPVQVSALCSGTKGSINPYVTLDVTNTSDSNSIYHDFRYFGNDSRPDWYREQMEILRSRWRIGWMGFTKSDLKYMINTENRLVAIYDEYVYDLTAYKNQNSMGGVASETPAEYLSDALADRAFMSDAIVQTFVTNVGQDVTEPLNALAANIGSDVLQWQKDCLRNLFIIGKVDTRDSVQCQFSTYILLALSCVMVAVIGFKFIASIHFGPSRAPENHDKFVICQVPCYTEGEDSLRRTIDSLAKLRYDDKRKLLFIICDGNIKGYGNEKATPAIVLDILGVDPNLDPEPLSFQSLGEGSKQHNMGKIYAGLYECSGHVVPYVVVVKVGKPTERPKPGNRGKRDSQMLLMHFLNKVSKAHGKQNVLAHSLPGPLQLAHEPARARDLSSDQERHWCQPQLLRVSVHGRCRYHCRRALAQPPCFRVYARQEDCRHLR